MIIIEENFKWHLEAFASELFISSLSLFLQICSRSSFHRIHRLEQCSIWLSIRLNYTQTCRTSLAG